MINYAEMKKAEEINADLWLKENAEALRDNDPEAETYGQKKGYEVQGIAEMIEQQHDVYNEVFETLAREEVQDGYWEDDYQELSNVEARGMENVAPLDRWTKGDKEFENEGSKFQVRVERWSKGNLFKGAAFSRKHWDSVYTPRPVKVWSSDLETYVETGNVEYVKKAHTPITPKKIEDRRVAQTAAKLKKLARREAIMLAKLNK